MKRIFKKHKVCSFGSVSFQHLHIFDTRGKAKLPISAKSVLIIIFPYYSKNAFMGNLSAYCSVKDYHFVIMEQLKSIIFDLKKLFPLEEFVPFVDVSPVDEVDAAVKAGLGIKGKNSLLITPLYGSFVFIGEIVTTLQLEDILQDDKGCMGCGICQKSCPGRCISDTGIIKESCASFISQKKQSLTKTETEILKRADTVFGCDICQNVCPHNSAILSAKNISSPLLAISSIDKNTPHEISENLFRDDIVSSITPQNVEGLYKTRAFGFRGLSVLQRNLALYNEDKA